MLISGGSGSFGRAFARYALDQGVERVCILSRGEHAQAEMAAEFNEPDRLRFFIGDVRDRERLRRAFDGVTTVVHAAALKRIETCEYNPTEVVKTNVNGAINVIEAALDAGVKKVVALSSDKAFEPVSPYGQSKALAEALFLGANRTRRPDDPMFAVCRYGNVAGSRGSVIPKWQAMKHRGVWTVPVSDLKCTRFWMKMDEAVGLVWRTIKEMKGGELNIPDLPAYKLGDLVQAMGVKPNVIGLEPWEKKHESMKEGLCSETARRMTIDEIARGIDGLHHR